MNLNEPEQTPDVSSEQLCLEMAKISSKTLTISLLNNEDDIIGGCGEPLEIPEAWIPAEKLKNLKFISCPSYVDEECHIYLHDYHESM